MGISSIVTIILYLVYVRQIFHFEQKQPSAPPQTESLTYSEIPIKTVYLKFAMVAVAIIGAGIWLSFIGDEIARTTGWDASFVGSLFLAVSTSMPELVVTVAAIRLGAADMAVSDILGAIMFNIFAILWSDLFYTHVPILSAVCSSLLFTVFLAIIL